MLNEEEMFDDVGFDEAEGAADAYDEGDEFDEFDEGDEADEYDEGDEGDEFSGFDEGDEFDSFDESGESDEEEDEDAFDTIVANALGAEDTDEFFRRIVRGLRRGVRTVGRIARRAAPIVGQVARVAGPALSLIPHPAAQVAGRVAGVLGRLMADGASEEDALDAMAEYAVRDRRVLPVVAGLAVRAVSRGATARLSPQARVRAVRAVRRTMQGLVQQQGRAAARSVAPIVRSVRRTAAVRRTPPVARPRVLQRTIRRVAQSPRMAQRLSRPSPQAQAILRRVGVPAPGGGALAPAGAGTLRRPGLGGRFPRAITLRGPIRITIRPA